MQETEFEEELVSYYPYLLNYARKLTNYDEEEAKELVQETYATALTHSEKFRDNNNLRAWATTIMHNIFVNNYKRIQRSKTIFLSNEVLYIIDIPNSPSISENPEIAFTVKEIDKIIKTTQKEYLIPFQLLLEGNSYKEIAIKLDIPEATVKRRIYEFRKENREKLKGFRK